jgi:hypothetical protein
MTPHTEHDSKTAPVEGCPDCKREVHRRTHRCFGDGSSAIPLPKVEEPDEQG